MEKERYPLYGEMVFSVFFLVLALFAYYEALYMTSGTWYSPSAFPKLISILIVLFSSYELITLLLKSHMLRRRGMNFVNLLKGIIVTAVDKNVLFMMLMILLFVFMLPFLGFVFTAMIFLFNCMFFYCEKKDLRTSVLYLLYSTGFAGFSVLVFGEIFKVILP
ncbi:MAG: tripartite tricarboxylate transporter TctB family protein [Synergistetes bacterium]|nr:MAG: hypothetical protein XD52_0580 [bacterium 42_11]MBC7330896.1 tripartite tricarboxylate transporter TctB family protein [Synergistota bacterium]MDK2870855.1 Tripartite tricarboxylate transporter TctB family [bacterium]